MPLSRNDNQMALQIERNKAAVQQWLPRRQIHVYGVKARYTIQLL